MKATESLRREHVFFPAYTEEDVQNNYGRIGREMNMITQDEILKNERENQVNFDCQFKDSCEYSKECGGIRCLRYGVNLESVP